MDDTTSKLDELAVYARHWFTQRRDRLVSEEERLEISFVDGVIACALAMDPEMLRRLEREVAVISPNERHGFTSLLRRHLFQA